MYQSPKASLLFPRTEEVLAEDPTLASNENEGADNLVGVDELLGELLG